MIVSTITATLDHTVAEVWQCVTDVQHYDWRSDLSRTEISEEGHFIEYTHQGEATAFVITTCIPEKEWAFTLENRHIKGMWQGCFTAKEKQTMVTFTERITPKQWWMRPFIKGYIKKQQARFIQDLKAALDTQNGFKAVK